MLRTLARAAVVLSASLPVGAQTLELVLERNDQILIGGALTQIKRFSKLGVSGAGRTYVEVTTGANIDAVLLDGWTVLAEGSPVLAGSDLAYIDQFQDMSVNASGDVGWPLKLVEDDPSTPNITPDNDSGVFWNAHLLAQEGDFALTDVIGAQPFASTPVYEKFYACKLNGAQQLLVLADVRVNGVLLSSLFLLGTDGAGNATSQEFLYASGFPLAATGEIVDFVGTGGGIGGGSTNVIASNERGEHMAVLQLVDGTSLILHRGAVVAREGAPSPDPTRTYASLAKVDLNDFGDYVFSASLDASNPSDNAIIVKNGAIFAREGDPLPGAGGALIEKFPSSPVYVTNNGDVFWYCETTDESGDDFYMRGDQILVRENVTPIGQTGAVTGVRNGAYGFHVTRSGRFWLGEVDLDSGGEAVVLADFGALYELPGCTGNAGTLRRAASTEDARAGNLVVLEMDDAQVDGALPLVLWSLAPAKPAGLCGIQHRLGEILIHPGRLVGKLPGPAWSTGAPSELQIPIPLDSSLVDLKLWGQGVFVAPGGTSSETYRLTNGIYMEIGAP